MPVPTSRIGRLDFSSGLEDIASVDQDERIVLPRSEQLRPSTLGPASPVEEVIGARSFADAIDACIQPAIIDMSICRPERYGALLAEAQDLIAESLRRTDGDADLEALVSVLDRQSELRGLLGYYIQSLLNA